MDSPIQDVGAANINSVPDLSVHSENAAYMNNVCDDGDCPMDFMSPNGARIGLVVHKLLVQGMHWAHN